MEAGRSAAVLLIGGTSHVGKSTVARAVAARLGWAEVSTDRLGRHPGRPWGQMGSHVPGHYRTLSVDELTAAQLAHYRRLWPTVAALSAEGSLREAGVAGMVIEGSGVLPELVGGLPACWLTASPAVLAARIRAGSGYAARPPGQRQVIDKFVGRTVRFDERMRAALGASERAAISVDGWSEQEIAELVLRAVERG